MDTTSFFFEVTLGEKLDLIRDECCKCDSNMTFVIFVHIKFADKYGIYPRDKQDNDAFAPMTNVFKCSVYPRQISHLFRLNTDKRV